MTRTATRLTDQNTCRTLVEHFEPEASPDTKSDLDRGTPELDTDTQPLPVIMMHDERQTDKFNAIGAEVTKILVRTLLFKRFLSRLFFKKGVHTVVVSFNGYLFDVIKDKVSCSATQALATDKELLRELLQSAANGACDEVAGAKFVRFIPFAQLDGKSHAVHTDSFVLEVDFA